MKTCSHCGQAVPDESRFCLYCGKEIIYLRCTQCGFGPLSEEAVFCPMCGQQLVKKTVVAAEQQSLTLDARQQADAKPALSPVLQRLMNNMVYVEGGTFMMGATPAQEARNDEFPVHQVTLSSFSIGRYEVTQEEWEAVMGSNPSYFKGNRRPVANVSWDDCQKFICQLNHLTGKHFHLPTEAEWEFAARGGNLGKGKDKDNKYAGSNDLDHVAWYNDNSGKQTHNVGSKQPNELGLYDMSGNVWEWVQDWYGRYPSSAQTNPIGPSSGSYRVNRGGGFNYDTWYCRVAIRYLSTPSERSLNLGLRLAL